MRLRDLLPLATENTQDPAGRSDASWLLMVEYSGGSDTRWRTTISLMTATMLDKV